MTFQDRESLGLESRPERGEQHNGVSEPSADERSKRLGEVGRIIRLLLPVLLIVGGYFLAQALIALGKTPPKLPPSERSIVVDTIQANTGRSAPLITAYGTVAPLRSLVVRPQVGGLVTEISPKLLAGGRLDEGELLFRIDPRDYEFSIESARADLINARFELEIERGRGAIAETEWELLESTLDQDSEGRRLALRQPQAEERAASVASANSRLARAELDLARTEVRTPFPALVISESIEKGQLLTMGVETARIVDTSVYVVELSLPTSRLDRIQLPDADGSGGASALVQLEGVPGAPLLEGRVARLLGEVDPEGRMARLQVEVEDPLSLQGSGPAKLPLLVGAYARVSMKGTPLQNVTELPRSALREGDTVWLRNKDGRLEVIEVDVAQGTPDLVWVRGLETGVEVVTSSLSAPLPGLLLKPSVAESEEEAPATSEVR